MGNGDFACNELVDICFVWFWQEYDEEEGIIDMQKDADDANDEHVVRFCLFIYF